MFHDDIYIATLAFYLLVYMLSFTEFGMWTTFSNTIQCPRFMSYYPGSPRLGKLSIQG